MTMAPQAIVEALCSAAMETERVTFPDERVKVQVPSLSMV